MEKMLEKLAAVILGLTSLAALIAVYTTLFGTGGASFGSTTSSLALIALAINLHLFVKQVK